MLFSNPALSILLVGFVFILAFGALSYLRRQGVSARFAVEGLIVTAVGAVAASFVAVNILAFLIVLYLITMRVRLLADVGNWLTASRRYEPALRVYRFALRLAPDVPSRQIVLINQGVTQLYMKEPQAAVTSLEEALSYGQLGAKYLSAGHYNLGLAYKRVGRKAEAIRELNRAIDAWPASIYATHARAALDGMRGPDDSEPRGGESD